jgi:hypothetical protein
MADVRLARAARLLDDPALGGDLLLAGLGFARFLDHAHPDDPKVGTAVIARRCWPDRGSRAAAYKMQRVLAGDARAYLPPHQWDARDAGCGSPMIRRDGTCGQRPKWSKLLTDWDTGERWWLLACARHVPWYDDTARANREAKPQRPPMPAANHGGLLAAHFPELDWPAIWRWATDGRWVEHPEVEPWRPPTLSIVLGDGEHDGDVPPARPLLGLVTS